MTDPELEKVEAIRRRLPVSYREARLALEATGGDLIEALARLEEELQVGEGPKGFLGKTRLELGRLWKEGNSTRVRISRGSRLFVDVPVTVGLVAAVVAPSLTAAAALAALAADCRLSLEKDMGSRAVVDGMSRV